MLSKRLLICLNLADLMKKHFVPPVSNINVVIVAVSQKKKIPQMKIFVGLKAICIVRSARFPIFVINVEELVIIHVPTVKELMTTSVNVKSSVQSVKILLIIVETICGVDITVKNGRMPVEKYAMTVGMNWNLLKKKYESAQSNTVYLLVESQAL